MTRAAALAAPLLAVLLLLTACGNDHSDDTVGPLGLTGGEWFVVILVGIVTLGTVLRAFAGGRDDDGDDD